MPAFARAGSVAAAFLAAVVSTGGAQQPVPAAGELLSNPGFESTIEPTAAGWQPQGADFTLDRSGGRVGLQSVRCENRSASDRPARSVLGEEELGGPQVFIR
jgi:hypothetical protein